MSHPRLTFHGAARAVTGSCFRLETDHGQILIDCGLFQGSKTEKELKYRSFPFAPNTISSVILSHAHIDHSGRIPCLVRNGFEGSIFCTSATRDLCAVMLMDSAYIQEKDVEFVNRRRQKNGQRLFEPLYTKLDVARGMEQFVGLSYQRPHQLFPGIQLTLVDAGHMLGSSHVVLDIDDRETGRSSRLVFSGDIGRVDKVQWVGSYTCGTIIQQKSIDYIQGLCS